MGGPPEWPPVPAFPSMFEPQALQKHIDTALNAIPSGKRGALVATATLDGTIEFRVAHRVGEVWQIGAVAYRRKGNLGGMVEVKATW